MKVVVLHKEGKWYCKYPGYNGWPHERAQINGEDAVICPDTQWCYTTNEPKSVSVWEPETTILVGYVRKPEFTSLAIDLPMEVPPEFFKYDDSYSECRRDNHEWLPFYEEKRETREGYFKPLKCEITIADINCEPTKFDFPVRVNPPEVFSKYPETHHLYPCSISSEDLFDYVWDKIDAALDGKKNLRRDNYRDIKTLTVQYRFRLADEKERQRDISNLYSKKPKWQKYNVEEEWRDLLNICAGRESKYGGELVPSLSGKNYEELKTKVNSYVNSKLEKLNDRLIGECPHCEGNGWIEIKDDR